MIRSCGPVEKTVQQLRGPSMGELACKENGKQCNFASCSPCRASYRGDITLQNACQAVICLLKCWSITLFKLIIHCQIIIQRASGAHWRPAEGADGQQAATSTVADSWLCGVSTASLPRGIEDASLFLSRSSFVINNEWNSFEAQPLLSANGKTKREKSQQHKWLEKKREQHFVPS